MVGYAQSGGNLGIMWPLFTGEKYPPSPWETLHLSLDSIVELQT